MLAAVGIASSVAAASQPPPGWPSDFNVRWTERHAWPQHGALGSVPIGSGRSGANVWADDDGVQILLSATEAYSEYSQLMKLGQLSLMLEPNPFAPLPSPPPPPTNSSACSSMQTRIALRSVAVLGRQQFALRLKNVSHTSLPLRSSKAGDVMSSMLVM